MKTRPFILVGLGALACVATPESVEDDGGPRLDLSSGGGEEPIDEPADPAVGGSSNDGDSEPDPPEEPPEQPSEPPEDPGSMQTGPADGTASRACDLFGQGTQETVQAASRFGQAAQALITPSENTVYTIHRQPGDGFLVIEVPDWHVELRVFAEPGTTYEVLDTGGATTMVLNGSCPTDGITDQTWQIHDWGTYVVRFDDSSPNPLQLAVIQLD